MLHRALFGSFERFIGILIEHYAGAFPLWLAPRQMMIIPVNNDLHMEYAKKVQKVLKEAGIKAEIDTRNEKMNYKIRESQTNKIPYTLVLGDKEVANNEITYRHHGTTNSVTVTLDEFVKMVSDEVKNLGK